MYQSQIEKSHQMLENAVNSTPKQQPSTQQQEDDFNEDDDDFQVPAEEITEVRPNRANSETSSRAVENEQDSEADPEKSSYKVKLSKKAIKNILAESDEESLEADIIGVEEAIELFLNSKFNEAEIVLKQKYGKSLYYTFGFGFIRFLKALMTFDPDDIQIALDSLRLSQDIAEKLRKDNSCNSPKPGKNDDSKSKWSFSSMFGLGKKREGEYLRELTKVQRFYVVNSDTQSS